MFLDELSPLFKELMQNPVAFTGGLVSGLLRLDLNQDPVKSWLEKQGASLDDNNSGPGPGSSGGSSGPTSISID